MGQLMSGAFQVIDFLFKKIPLLSKHPEWACVLGLVGLAAVTLLDANKMIDPSLVSGLQLGFSTLAGVAANSSGRKEEEKK